MTVELYLFQSREWSPVWSWIHKSSFFSIQGWVWSVYILLHAVAPGESSCLGSSCRLDFCRKRHVGICYYNFSLFASVGIMNGFNKCMDACLADLMWRDMLLALAAQIGQEHINLLNVLHQWFEPCWMQVLPASGKSTWMRWHTGTLQGLVLLCILVIE